MANITIPRSVAEQLYELYHNVESADAHYKRCQSDNFRVHVKSVYQSKAIENAFADLKNALDSAETEDALRSAEKASRGVLARE